MSIKRDITWRIYFCFLLVCAAGLAVLIQVGRIQFVQGGYWKSRQDSLSTKLVSIDAERGNIYSSDGRLLATSLPSFELRWDLKADYLTNEILKSKIDSLAEGLEEIFGEKSAQDWKTQIMKAKAKGDRYFLLNREVDFITMDRVKNLPLFRNGSLKAGLIVIQKNKRINPYNSLALRTIGYVRTQDLQPIGIEAKFDSMLRGMKGQRLEQKISGGIWKPIRSDNEVEPLNGRDIITTIDISIQDVAENALQKTLIRNKADHGCVVVMDVSTGAIKAIANLGKTEDDSYSEIFNYAIGEAKEPGSTFKLASMIALFEDGYKKISDTVDVERGKKKYFNQLMQDAEQHNHTNVTVKTAFAISSNVGISKMVYQNYFKNPEKYLAHLHNLHLDQITGIEIPGEAKPYIKNTKDPLWSGVSLPWMSVGYELRITPLQTLTLYNAVANGGKMMQPYLVSEIQEYGKPILSFAPKVLNEKICSDQTLAAVKILLEAVVHEGTGKNIENKFYSIAGKTGTAQIADEKFKYGEAYQSSFVGYFPADKPKYSCIVVVNNPTNGIYYGALVAAPVFREIADNIYSSDSSRIENTPVWFAQHSNVPFIKPGNSPDLNSIVEWMNLVHDNALLSAWTKPISDSTGIRFQPVEISTDKIPDVRGMGLRDALYILESVGYSVNVRGTGKVKFQTQPEFREPGQQKLITLILG